MLKIVFNWCTNVYAKIISRTKLLHKYLAVFFSIWHSSNPWKFNTHITTHTCPNLACNKFSHNKASGMKGEQKKETDYLNTQILVILYNSSLESNCIEITLWVNNMDNRRWRGRIYKESTSINTILGSESVRHLSITMWAKEGELKRLKYHFADSVYTMYYIQ